MQSTVDYPAIAAPTKHALSQRADLGVQLKSIVISAPNKTVAQVGEKAGWLRARGSSRRSA